MRKIKSFTMLEEEEAVLNRALVLKIREKGPKYKLSDFIRDSILEKAERLFEIEEKEKAEMYAAGAYRK